MRLSVAYPIPGCIIRLNMLVMFSVVDPDPSSVAPGWGLLR